MTLKLHNRASLSSLSGDGTNPGCGTDPCGVTDWVWASDACQQYLACSETPAQISTDWRMTGFVSATINQVGQEAGTAVGSTADSLLSQLNPMYLIAAVGLAAIVLMKK